MADHLAQNFSEAQVAPGVSHEQNALKMAYEAHRAGREFYTNRFQKVALLTQPSLAPPDGFNSSTPLDDPYQSTGAMGIESLASKLLLASFPAGVPFFGFVLTPAARREADAFSPAQRADLELALNERRARVALAVEQPLFRTRMMEMNRHLIASGNGLLQQIPGTTRFRFFPLARYVCARDNSDNVLEIILEERVDARTLTEAQRALLDPEKKEHVMYTGYIRRDQKTFDSYQELDGKPVPGSDADHPADLLPVVPGRWEGVSGESYGRSFGEKMLGDLATLESLSEALITIAAEAARVVPLVDPAGVTELDDVARAANGEYVWGRPQDVGYLRLDKVQDLQTAASLQSDVRKEVKAAFFSGTSVQRAGERVTATEISFLANELDNALGGGFSIIAEEIQAPILRLVIAELIRQGQVDPMPGELVEPKILSGLEGLGRARELQGLQAFLGAAVQLVPEGEIAIGINFNTVMTRLATLNGVDTTDLFFTSSEREQKAAQASQAQVRADAASAGATKFAETTAEQAAPK